MYQAAATRLEQQNRCEQPACRRAAQPFERAQEQERLRHRQHRRRALLGLGQEPQHTRSDVERVVGTAMMAGTEIMTIADLGAMEARVDIGEIDVVLIALGQKARLEVEAFRDKKFSGVVTEIANAFLTTDAAIAKRLTRAKQKIREAEIPFEIPTGEELARRLDGVLQSLYLLFNEGYKASAGEKLLREELCREAIRLALLLVEHPAGQSPQSHALLAFMLLTAARFPARRR